MGGGRAEDRRFGEGRHSPRAQGVSTSALRRPPAPEPAQTSLRILACLHDLPFPNTQSGPKGSLLDSKGPHGIQKVVPREPKRSPLEPKSSEKGPRSSKRGHVAVNWNQQGVKTEPKTVAMHPMWPPNIVTARTPARRLLDTGFTLLWRNALNTAPCCLNPRPCKLRALVALQGQRSI